MGSLRFKARGQTDVGQVRSVNQDSFLVDEKDLLFIVADGMGGHAGGEIASRQCIDEIRSYLRKHHRVFTEQGPLRESQIAATLSNSVNHASSRIYEHALEEPSLRGMGTTATVVKILNGKAYWAHVGDSRLYLIRSGYLYQMTFDHSLVNEQLRAGIITPEEAEMHHLKNVITRSVGYQEEEDVDTNGFVLEEGDRLVLCSDGLHGKVSDEELSNIVKESGVHAVSQLVDLANRRGGEDNITAIVIEIQESGTSAR